MRLTRRGFLAGAAALAATRGRADGPAGVGLDEVAREPARWRGVKVGVLAHAASVASDGRFVVDVLRGAGARVVRLFSPEHGLAGRAGASVRVDDASWQGLELVSLYGPRRRPEPAHLKGLDLLVVDLQDVGVRFYTYAATMLDALDAASEADVPAVVLDRPNPLGGNRIEGPFAEPAFAPSVFNRVPGPLVHGLTLAEIASRLRPTSNVDILFAPAWERDQQWDDLRLPWRPPSPNLRTFEAALAYPGTALLEQTNVSEGRGTDAPFLLLGAPWLRADVARDVDRVPGFELEPARFTPVRSEAAPDPKYAGVTCHGIRVHVRDSHRARPWQLGLTLLHALRRERGFQLLEEGRALDRLISTGVTRRQLEAGRTVREILAGEARDLERWIGMRRSPIYYS